MLGLALNLDALYQSGKIPFCHDSFQIKTFQTFNDEFMSAMLLALWRSAKVYGISTLFFEQGVQQILDHITNTSSPYPTLPNRRPLTRRSLARVHSLVENNFHTNISVAKMAGLLEMNETSFSKSFTRSTGQTPFTYITAYRMKQAQSLLKLNYSVTDVAVSVGYANPSKFSAAFRRHVGITPSAWRKNNINCKK